jgi:hypothetical protein
MSTRILFLILSFLISLSGCQKDEADPLNLIEVFAGETSISLTGPMTTNVPVDRSISLVFSSPVNQSSVLQAISLLEENQQKVEVELNFSGGGTVTLFPKSLLQYGDTYTIQISEQLRGIKGERFIPRKISFGTTLDDLELIVVKFGEQGVTGNEIVQNVSVDLTLSLTFSVPVTLVDLQNADLITGLDVPSMNYQLSNDAETVTITTAAPLRDFQKYTFSISDSFKGVQGEHFSGYTREFFTGKSKNPKFPVISEADLLTKVQSQTFKYFWDFAHPASSMARERNSSGDIVTTGGSGFGIMALIVGIQRNLITREQGLGRMEKILDFLETADRFHGAWSHWLNGNTGDVVPFSQNDNGGDLVETSFLIQGLITFRQYLNAGIPEEQSLISRINVLWQSVEWDWYTRGQQDVLYWHWSPDKEWIMNHPIKGYNECLITYVLAASSPSHAIDKTVYTSGWASNGAIVNGKAFYNITLPLGFDYGGPLFFAHYSFLGLDPRKLTDAYGNYWKQNVNHSLINRAHAIANPRHWVGYSDESWGLTASDNPQGYAAHAPTNDLGVITPTAALSSFPYTPEASMAALHFFYYSLGDRLWGPYGFYDAFNLTESWTANSYLAIDQGPIVVMIENYRTGLLWDLFMSAPEVKNGLTKLSFTY